MDGEHGLQAGHLQDLANRRARRGERQVTALLAGQPVGGQQHVHARGVAEIDRGHVHHDLPRLGSGEGGSQFGLQPRRRVKVDLASEGEDYVLTLGPA